MTAPPARTRILFVDDEPSIRLTMTAILQQNGFDVTPAATVAKALYAINSEPFDALISDLNIGEPGDGFTVVSAMRRTQPACINFILTGYPAFETALQAIRDQVDDYLVKPANVRELVASLQAKLQSPRDVRRIQVQSLATFLREHIVEICGLSLLATKSDKRLATVSLSDQERTYHVPKLIEEIIRQLESEHPDEATEGVLAAGAMHGATRRKQGYSPEMLVDDIRWVENCMYQIIQGGLLKLELSNLLPDLRHVNSALAGYLQACLKAFDIRKVA